MAWRNSKDGGQRTSTFGLRVGQAVSGHCPVVTSFTAQDLASPS